MAVIKDCDKPAELDRETLLLERRPKCTDNMKLCVDCNRFIAGSNFWRHRRLGCGENATSLDPAVMFLAKPHHDEDFATNILQRFRRTEAGQLCLTDDLIQQVGFRHYCLRRCYKSKIGEVQENVMQEMRELARSVSSAQVCPVILFLLFLKEHV